MENRRTEIMMEAKCPCKKCVTNPYININYMLIGKVLILENNIGKRVIITSGNRCIEYNKIIGGYIDSPHIPKPQGEALDMQVKGMGNIELAYAAEKAGFKRIGIYPNHVHGDMIDPRPSKYWYVKNYNKSPIYSGDIKTLGEFIKKVIK